MTVKKFLLGLLLLLPSWVSAQTTVTGTLRSVTTQPVNTNTSFVQFTLKNFGIQTPIVSSTGDLAQVQVQMFPDVNGNISGVLYGNDIITPQGTYYHADTFYNGVLQHGCDYLISSGSAFNLNTAPCLGRVLPIGVTQVITQAFFCPNTVPSTTWVCTHNFNDVDVSVDTYDLNSHRIFPDTLTITSPTTVTITWVVAQAGYAVISHAGSVSIATNQPNAVLQNPAGTQSVCCFSLTVSAPLVSTNTATFNGAVTDNGTHTFNSTATFSGPLITPTVGPSSGQQHIVPAVTSDTFSLLNASQTLINKIFNVASNTLVNTTNTAGNVLRNNGTQYVDATLAASDLSNGVSGSGAVVLGTGASIGSPTITTPVLNGATTGTGVQGTDTKLLSSGTISGTGATLCTDGNGGATTSSCSAATVLLFSRTTLGANVSGSTSAQDVMTLSVTMPSIGCPCRAQVAYSLYVSSAGSGQGYATWVDDATGAGTPQFAGNTGGQSNGASGAAIDMAETEYSANTYTNGQAVTFHLKIQGTFSSFTVNKTPFTGSGPNSSFQVAILSSN